MGEAVSTVNTADLFAAATVSKVVVYFGRCTQNFGCSKFHIHANLHILTNVLSVFIIHQHPALCSDPAVHQLGPDWLGAPL